MFKRPGLKTAIDFIGETGFEKLHLGVLSKVGFRGSGSTASGITPPTPSQKEPSMAFSPSLVNQPQLA